PGQAPPTAFGRDICGELRRLALDPEHQLLLVIVTTPGDGVGLPPALPRCPLSAREAPGEGQPEPCQLRLALGVQGLTEPDRHLWWEAVVAQGAPGPGAAADSLCALDAWWETARRPLASPAPRHAPVGAAGRELMALLGLARQALTGAEVRGLGRAAAALQGLLGAGLVEARPGDRFVARPGVWGAEAASCAGRRRLAAVLAGAGSDAVPADAWSLMRASELRAELGDAAVAEELAFAALRRVGEASAREDMWRRWQDTAARLGAQPGGPDDVAQLARLERSAELALSLGDGDRAERLARQALRLDGQRFETLLLHGRACLVRGDLEASSAALGTALERAATPLDRARASAALAELRHAQGDYAAAARHAADAGRGGPGLAARRARLGGRNVLGKLLLAQAAWRQAEQHFAADAQEAARVGDAEAELRARLNRAVAVLSAGRRDEARSCFEEILAESERRGALRAVGYALSNLAAIAILDLDFCRGLELSERAIGLRHRLGERLGLVRPITNLADLRLQLGLVSEAEQALRFGAKACGDGLPPSHQIYFGLCAARIELAQGRTGAAGRQLGAARAAAAASATTAAATAA
ncbi:MAG: hypothetical protein HY744_17140, partial [Deltaproteobacteria bacterium]|nr:hypothetical protein [Deltaproteobacteria bacterium]